MSYAKHYPMGDTTSFSDLIKIKTGAPVVSTALATTTPPSPTYNQYNANVIAQQVANGQPITSKQAAILAAATARAGIKLGLIGGAIIGGALVAIFKK